MTVDTDTQELKQLLALSRDRDLNDIESQRIIELMHTEKYTY